MQDYDSESTTNVGEDIPSVAELGSIMNKHSDSLYREWKRELSVRLRQLEFEGYIGKMDVNLSHVVYRLPNQQVRRAICQLENDLELLGYDYNFRFEDVEGVNWVLFYRIMLPDTEYDIDSDTPKDDEKANSDDADACDGKRRGDGVETDADDYFAY